MPFRVCWVYWRALEMYAARDTLATARAIGLALSDGEGGRAARERAIDDALPRGEA